MSQLTDRPVGAETRPAEHRRRSMRAWPMIALAALLLGALGGWWVTRDDGSPAPAAVAAGNTELTDRQEDMVAMARDYMAAWQANDAEQVLGFLTPYASFVPVPAGVKYAVADGSLQAYVESADWSNLQVVDPILVNDYELTVVSTLSGSQYTNLLRFTSSGELQVMLHMTTSP